MHRLLILFALTWLLILAEPATAQAEFWARPHTRAGTPPSATQWVPTSVVRDDGWCGGMPGFDACGNLPCKPTRDFVPLYDPGMFLRKYAPISCDGCENAVAAYHQEPRHKRQR